jgi:hypothetical protein
MDVFTEIAPLEKGSPCMTVMVPKAGLFTLQPHKTMGGLPTYAGDGQFLYYYPYKSVWQISNDDKWDAISEGENWKFAEFETGQLECANDDGGLLPSEGDGPCPMLLIKGSGVFTLQRDTKVGGIPTYLDTYRGSKRNFAFLRVKDKQWFVADSTELYNVQKSKAFSAAKKDAEDVVCSDPERAFAELAPRESTASAPCSHVFVPEQGVFELRTQDKVGGLPTYWQWDRLLYYYPGDDAWLLTGEDKYSEVQQGEGWSSKKFPGHQLECRHGARALPLVTQCSKTVSVDGFGSFQLSDRDLGNLPTFATPDGTWILHFAGRNTWNVIKPQEWSAVAAGNLASYKRVKVEEMDCRCQDSPKISGFQGVITCSDASDGKYGKDLTCQPGAKYEKTVQTYCPRTCGLC